LILEQTLLRVQQPVKRCNSSKTE